MTPIISLGKDAKIIHERNILLKIVEDPQSAALLNERSVKRLLSISNLCHDDIRILIDNLIEKETIFIVPSFFRNILRFGKELEKLQELSNVFMGWFESLKELGFYPSVEATFKESLEKTLKEKFEKMGPVEKENLRTSLVSSLGWINEEQLLKDDEELVAIDKELEKRIGFGILIPSRVLFCPNCDVILSTEEYKTYKKCIMCNKRIRRQRAKIINVHKVPKSIKDVWTSNLWFEAFLAKLLRELGWKESWVNVHILGSSGMLHEVDVLAIKKGTVIVSECKTGKVSRKDVFNFWAKVSDLKAHMGILALLKSLPEPETREFVKKNPVITLLEKMGDSKEEQIINELTKRLIV